MTKEYIFCPICGASLQIGMIEGKERKYCPKCDFVDYRNPLPVALAIAVKDKDFPIVSISINIYLGFSDVLLVG